jgi:hypothetical protein
VAQGYGSWYAALPRFLFVAHLDYFPLLLPYLSTSF